MKFCARGFRGGAGVCGQAGIAFHGKGDEEHFMITVPVIIGMVLVMSISDDLAILDAVPVGPLQVVLHWQESCGKHLILGG